jgi:hypothetical protein
MKAMIPRLVVILAMPLLTGCAAVLIGGMVGMGAAMTLTGDRGEKACAVERQAVAAYLDRLQTVDSLPALVPEYRIRLEALLMRCKQPSVTEPAAELRKDVERLATLGSDELPLLMAAHLPRVRRFLDLLSRTAVGSGT